MKIELVKENEKKVFEELSLFPLTVSKGTKINNLDLKTNVVELDCSNDETIELINFFINLMEERYTGFEKVGANYIDKYDKNTKKTWPRYLLVFKNIKNSSDELKERVLYLWQRSRASGIAHIYIVDSLDDLFEPLKISNKVFGF